MYQPGDSLRHIDLLYYDSYSAPTSASQNSGSVQVNQATVIDESLLGEHCFSLLPRSRTRAMDDKAELARALMAEGVPAPRVYFAVEDVPEDSASLWFVKEPFRSGGKGIAVVPWSELQSRDTSGCIIQEAIQDLALIDGRKFTLRLYVLAHAGRLYLYSNGFAVVHKAPYRQGSTDPDVQFLHDGYLNSDSGIRLVELGQLPEYDTILKNAADMLANSFAVFGNRLKYEPVTQYCLFGVDILVRQNLGCVLVEINDRPNIVHSAAINQQVNIPMLRHMAGILNSAWSAGDVSESQFAEGDVPEREDQFTLLVQL